MMPSLHLASISSYLIFWFARHLHICWAAHQVVPNLDWHSSTLQHKWLEGLNAAQQISSSTTPADMTVLHHGITMVMPDLCSPSSQTWSTVAASWFPWLGGVWLSMNIFLACCLACFAIGCALLRGHSAVSIYLLSPAPSINIQAILGMALFRFAALCIYLALHGLLDQQHGSCLTVSSISPVFFNLLSTVIEYDT